MLENIVKGKIANALTSAAKDHVVATTDDIYDLRLGMYQEDINALIGNVDERIAELENTVSGISFEISTIKNNLLQIQNDIQTLIDTKQDKLVAGENIIISGTTISATYTEPEVTVPEVLEVLTEDD